MKSDEIDAIVEDIILKDGKAEESVDRRRGQAPASGGSRPTARSRSTRLKPRDLLGKTFSVYDLLVNVSSTIGRAYTLGSKFTITSELMGLDRALTDI